MPQTDCIVSRAVITGLTGFNIEMEGAKFLVICQVRAGLYPSIDDILEVKNSTLCSIFSLEPSNRVLRTVDACSDAIHEFLKGEEDADETGDREPREDSPSGSGSVISLDLPEPPTPLTGLGLDELHSPVRVRGGFVQDEDSGGRREEREAHPDDDIPF